MASVRFNLRDKKTKTKETPIYMIVEHQGKRLFKYATGLKICPNQWDEKNNRVQLKGEIRNKAENINTIILNLKKKVNDRIVHLLANDEVLTGEAIKEVFENSKKKLNDNFIIDFLTTYNKNLSKEINPKTGRKLSRQTLNKYDCLKKVLLELQSLAGGTLTFERFDLQMYYNLIDLLQTKDFQPNTIGSKYIEPLKSIANEAVRKGVKVNGAFKDRKFSTPKEETEKIYLNDTEIEKIKVLDLKENTRLERVRDVFLIGYYTGQRFGDYSTFEKSMFENGKKLKIIQNKNTKRVTIPINDYVLQIMERYEWNLPKISNQKFNDYLKEVCKIAAIDSEISRTYQLGKNEVSKVHKKYELVGSHTARRSYATNAYLKNPSKVLHIMKVTGHSTEKQFLKYICFTDDENMEVLTNMQGEKHKNISVLRVA